MGYYTQFQIETVHRSVKDYVQHAIEMFPDNGEWYGLPGVLKGNDERMKWYDWAEDMKKFSAAHPFEAFILIGEGEESGDNWRALFKNGQMVQARASIHYPELTLGGVTLKAHIVDH
jgi:hypothetical protein